MITQCKLDFIRIYISLFSRDPDPAVRPPPRPPKLPVVPVPRPMALVPNPVFPNPVRCHVPGPVPNPVFPNPVRCPVPNPLLPNPVLPCPVPSPPVPLAPCTLLVAEPVGGLPTTVALLPGPVPGRGKLLPCEAVPPNLVLPTPLLNGNELPRLELPGLELPRLVLPCPVPTFTPLVAGLLYQVEPAPTLDPKEGILKGFPAEELDPPKVDLPY